MSLIFHTCQMFIYLCIFHWECLVVAERKWVAPPQSDEKFLIQFLLDQYELVDSRPVQQHNTTVEVDVGFVIISLDLIESNGSLIINTWVKYVWEDEYMTWDPKEFNDVTQIHVNVSNIWQPDVVLLNTGEMNFPRRNSPATIYANGTVLLVAHHKFNSYCPLDITNFPFDSQTCELFFGSSAYGASEVDLSMAFENGMDLTTIYSDLPGTSQWKISSMLSHKFTVPNANGHPYYVVLMFRFRLKRHLTFATYILTLPCIFLVCLTLVVFLLPPQRYDRTLLGGSVIGSFMLLLLILVESVPPLAGSMPLIGVYYACNILLIIVTVFMSSLVINLVQPIYEDLPVPKWLKMIALQYKRFCLFRRRRQKAKGRVMNTEDCYVSNLFNNELHAKAAQLLLKLGEIPLIIPNTKEDVQKRIAKVLAYRKKKKLDYLGTLRIHQQTEIGVTMSHKKIGNEILQKRLQNGNGVIKKHTQVGNGIAGNHLQTGNGALKNHKPNGNEIAAKHGPIENDAIKNYRLVGNGKSVRGPQTGYDIAKNLEEIENGRSGKHPLIGGGISEKDAETSTSGPTNELTLVIKEVKTVVESIQEVQQFLIKLCHQDIERKERLVQWKKIAVMLDRTFFMIYAVVYLVIALTLFPRPNE